MSRPEEDKKLRLDSRAGVLKGGETGAIVVPGNSEQSLIVRRLLGLDGEDRMPKDGDPLPAAQIALIRSWIDQGAIWPGHGRRGWRLPDAGAENAAVALGVSAAVASGAARRAPGPNGCARQSIASSWPGSRRKG